MSENSENNDLIDLGRPAKSTARLNPHENPPLTEPVKKIKDVTGKSTFSDYAPVSLQASVASDFTDEDFAAGYPHDVIYKRYDWFRSWWAYLAVIIILGLTYWWLLGWGIPFIDHAIEDGRYDDVVMIAILWLLPISAYSWFRKCQLNPGWDTDSRPTPDGRTNYLGWF